jgi:hypothetical protein
MINTDFILKSIFNYFLGRVKVTKLNQQDQINVDLGKVMIKM